jgi:hypothetical protein
MSRAEQQKDRYDDPSDDQSLPLAQELSDTGARCGILHREVALEEGRGVEAPPALRVGSAVRTDAGRGIDLVPAGDTLFFLNHFEP